LNTTLAVIGALGGLTAFGAAVWAVVRSIAKQVGATKDNTEAVKELTRKLDALDGKVDEHSTRIARLEGWRQQ
jgi:hypothetical protein